MVETALTPGIFSAAAVSINLILAWACGLYSITANKVPSGRVSLGYLARPDALARPSSLVILVPIKRGFSGQVRAMALGSFHRFGRVEGRLEDANIRSAPADVAVEPLPDLLERRVGVLVQHGLAGGDEPRRAVTAGSPLLGWDAKRKLVQFQSAPGGEAGGNPPEPRARRHADPFQSAPGGEAGGGGKESPPSRPWLVNPSTNNVSPEPISVGEDV